MGNHIAVYKINAKVKKVLKDNGYEEAGSVMSSWGERESCRLPGYRAFN